jgi:hypothetical protein
VKRTNRERKPGIENEQAMLQLKAFAWLLLLLLCATRTDAARIHVDDIVLQGRRVRLVLQPDVSSPHARAARSVCQLCDLPNARSVSPLLYVLCSTLF